MSSAIAVRAVLFLFASTLIIFAVFRCVPSPTHFSPPSLVLPKALSFLQRVDDEVNAFNYDRVMTASVPARRPMLTRRTLRPVIVRPTLLHTNNINSDFVPGNQRGAVLTSSNFSDFVPGNQRVAVLTSSNFSDFVSRNRYVVVNFYSPCCYWSRRLVPGYEEAATILEGEAVLANVDGTVETELKEKFDIQFYPTILLLLNGVHMTTHYGERTGNAIAAWVRQNVSPDVPTITTFEEAKRILATRSVMVIGFLDNPEGTDSEELVAASKQHKDVNFYQTTDVHVARLLRIGERHPALVMLRRMDEYSSHSHFDYDGPFNRFAISDFITALKCLLAVHPFGDRGMMVEKQVVNGLSDQDKSSWTENPVTDTFHDQEVEILRQNKPVDTVFNDEKSLQLRETKMKEEKSLWPDKRVFNLENNRKERSWQEKPVLDEGDIVVLTEKNFSDFVDRNQYVMLNFYAPWCFWSQKMAPEYAAAAASLKDEAVFAKIDATAEAALARKYDIRGYPTMILLISGVEKVHYNPSDERTRDAIATWVKQKMDVVVQTVETTEEAEHILTARSIMIMAFLDNLQGPDSMELSAASKLHTDVRFYQTAVAEVARFFHIDPEIKRPALVMLKQDASNHTHMIGFDGQFTKSAIAEFVSTYKVPSFMIFREEDGPNVFKNPTKKVWLFAPEHSWEVRNTFEEASNAFEGKLLFLFVEMDNFGERFAHSFGVAVGSPTVVALNAYDELVHSRKYGAELTLSGIKSFANEFLEDKFLSQ